MSSSEQVDAAAASAYEAYRAQMRLAEALPWEELPEDGRELWRAVALATIRAALASWGGS